MLDKPNGSPATDATARAIKQDSAWYWIGASAVAIVAIQFYLARTMGINWDEFPYYGNVVLLSSGKLTVSLQTFDAHLFGWLLNLPGDVTDRIRAARLIMLACELGAAAALFGVARRFASQTAAALVALAYVSAGSVVTQGSAFRADPQGGFLLMTALWLLACRPLGPLNIAAFGLLTGLAAAITIKVVIYAPAFVGIALLVWDESPKKWRVGSRLAACVASGVIVFSALYAWHSTFISRATLSRGAHGAVSAWRVVFFQGLFPQWHTLLREIVFAPHVMLLVVLTLICLPTFRLSIGQRRAIIGLMLPLAIVAVYRNSYAYFYVFLLPPVLAASAPAMGQMVMKRVGVAVPAAFMAAVALFMAVREPRGVLGSQKRTIAVAHQLFPAPVTYFDFSGYLGDYDRGLPLLNWGWSLSEYRRNGIPQFVHVMERKTVPLLIVNHWALGAAMLNEQSDDRLLKADEQALRHNYIHHWGILWVAGRHIPAGSRSLKVEVLVPGNYTLEGGALLLDGVSRKPGDVFEIRRGMHRIGGPRAEPSTLRWGNHMKVPSVLPPTEIFEPF